MHLKHINGPGPGIPLLELSNKAPCLAVLLAVKSKRTVIAGFMVNRAVMWGADDSSPRQSHHPAIVGAIFDFP